MEDEITTQFDLQQELVATQERLKKSLEDKQQLILKLKKSRREYVTIFDSVPAMIWYRDGNGRILKANQAAADSVGMNIQELLGRNYYELFPDGAKRARQQDLKVMETGKPICGQVRPFVSRNGLQRWALVDRIPLRDDKGRITGVMVFALDITEKKNAEEDLVQANDKIEQTNRRLKATARQARLLADKAIRSNQAKSELLASSSHDLRTPMNSIIGFAEILMDTALDDEQKEYAKTIHQSATGLLSLINDILDYSRIEAGKLKIRIVSCHIAEVVEEIRAMMETSARSKGLSFEVQTDKRLPETFFTDPIRLRQCLVNLVGNAVKFTEQGYVNLYVNKDERGGQACIRFDIEDSGIGIPLYKQELIFKSFTQATVATDQKYGGTGLGLAITQRLSNLLGGEVQLQSEPGKGSIFSLTLPLVVQGPCNGGLTPLGLQPKRRDDEDIQYTGRILLAERAFPSQLTLTLMLRRFGLDVFLCGSLEQIHEHLDANTFDLILLDAAWGFDALAAFSKDFLAHSPQTPLMLIADPDDCSMKTWSDAGFKKCLCRPLSRNQLFENIAPYLPEKTAALPTCPTESSDNAMASTEAIMDRLPELVAGIQEVLLQSDTELLVRFAELFVEIGQLIGHETIAETAAAILDCARQPSDCLGEMTTLVERLCHQCGDVQDTH